MALGPTAHCHWTPCRLEERRARVHHVDGGGRDAHAAVGFDAGWNAASARQLEVLQPRAWVAHPILSDTSRCVLRVRQPIWNDPMAKRTPVAEPEAFASYLASAPEPGRSRMQALADAVRAEAPDAIERMAYGLVTWHHRGNLIHLGAFAHHVGIYPGPEAIVAFAEDLRGFRTSKGAIQVAHDGPLPTELVRRITRWRVERVRSSPVKTKARA